MKVGAVPSVEEITELAEQLEKEFQAQREEDLETRQILHRKGLITTQNTQDKLPMDRIVTGYPALIVEQDYSFLTTPPFLRVNPLKPGQERHSEKLETALLGIWKLSQGISNVWLDMVYDFCWAGRGFSKIYPVPALWGEGQYEDEKDEDFLERIKQLKEDTFPIVWRSVPVENTWPTFNIRGELDQVVEISQLRVRDVRRHYSLELKDKAADSMIKVIDYADSEYTCCIIDDEKVREWEHGMGVCPYVMMQAPRGAPRGTNIHWTGALYHSRNVLTELDGLLTDIRYNVKRASRSQPVLQLNLDARGVTPEKRGKPDVIKFKPLEPIVLDIDEKVYELEPARTNVDAYRLVEIFTGLTREVGFSAVLMGILQSGSESGILYNTAAQFAQKQFGPAIIQLEKAAVDVGRKFFAALRSFADEDEAIPILFTHANGITRRIAITPNDTLGWDRTLQARIDLAIPINESSDFTNARLLTDPANPLLSYETVAARLLHIENAQEEEDKILGTQIRRALWPALIQIVQEQGLQLAQQPSGELGGMFGELDPGIQQAIASYSQAQGQPLPPEIANMARGMANTARTGMGQGLSSTVASQLGNAPTGVPS